MNETQWMLQVDRMIDQVVAGRAGTGPELRPGPAPIAADQALVAELSRLGPADWPADEVGERIASSVAELARQAFDPGAPAPPGSTSGHRRHKPARDRRRWPRAAAPLAAAAAVIAIVAGVLVIVNSPHGQRAAGQDRSASPAASAAPSATLRPTPAGPPSPFRYVGTGNLETSNFECVTASACYAWFTGNAGNGPNLRTSDGGATWRQLAGLPDGLVLTNQTRPSCPTARVCYASTGSLTLAVTTDGGSSWKLEQLPAPAGGSGDTVDQVSCSTALQCVAHVSAGPVGTFLSTTDGGQTWTTGTVPAGAPGTLYYLRCDTSGDCIGIYATSQAGLKVMHSTDHGLTWTVSSTADVPAATQLLMSCGDALHCVYVGDSGVAVTSDGGLTWRQAAIPATWNGNIAAVSCVTGLDCFAAVNDQTIDGGGISPLIATTRDGTAWSTQAAPVVAGAQLSEIDSLSCPGPDGCVALALNEAEFESGTNSPGGVQTSQRVVISSLAG